MQTEQQVEKGELKKKEEKQACMPAVPCPQRLQKEKMEEQFCRFLDVFKKIEINLPFVEALTHMHNYAKFLKDILSKKRKFSEEGVVDLTATCHSDPEELTREDAGSWQLHHSLHHWEF